LLDLSFHPEIVCRISLSKLCLFFEVDAHAIYVRNLPLNATETQLEDEFKKFGTIKENGIQVRSNKVVLPPACTALGDSFAILNS
jgi:RNA recognition motif-containing protein